MMWLSIVILFLFSAYFAIAETSFASSSKNKIKAKADDDNPKAETALYILENFDEAVTTILIGTNICHLAVASIVTVIVTRNWGISWVSLGTILTTLALFFFSEMLPKSLAKRYPEALALSSASLLRFFMSLFKPLSFLLAKIGQCVSKAGGEEEVSVTEDELYDIIEDMTDDGKLDEAQGDLLSSALDFGDTTVESILTARVDMEAVDVSWPSEKIMSYLKGHRHSRYPVYEENTDHIIGTIHLRKYLKAYLKNHDVNIRTLIDKPHFIHYSMKVDELLPDISAKKLTMAIVLDDFGGTMGIVTAEDVQEELVGEIWDEEDIVVESFKQLGENRYLVNATMTVGEIFDEMDWEPEEDDEDLEQKRASEWAFEAIGHVPSVGESFVFESLKVSIARMRGNRILLMIVEVEKGGEK